MTGGTAPRPGGAPGARIKPVISVSPDMDIRYTARLFSRFGIAVAPVIEQGEILGVVTYTDIVMQGLSACAGGR